MGHPLHVEPKPRVQLSMLTLTKPTAAARSVTRLPRVSSSLPPTQQLACRCALRLVEPTRFPHPSTVLRAPAQHPTRTLAAGRSVRVELFCLESQQMQLMWMWPVLLKVRTRFPQPHTAQEQLARL